jgi:hypothetical protein
MSTVAVASPWTVGCSYCAAFIVLQEIQATLPYPPPTVEPMMKVNTQCGAAFVQQKIKNWIPDVVLQPHTRLHQRAAAAQEPHYA